MSESDIYKGREQSAAERERARAYVRDLVESLLDTDDWTAAWSKNRAGSTAITLRCTDLALS